MYRFSFSAVLALFCLTGIMFSQNTNIKITAHRGASGTAPENTLSSMQQAINLHADYSELDAQETSDGEIIVLHDGSLKRTTGLDKNIWETSYEEIKKLDAGSWFNEKFKGEPLPKLADIIDLVKGKMMLNIELKTNGHEKKLADRVVKIVKENGFSKECILTSFDINEIKRAKEIDSTLKVGLIFAKMPDTYDVFKANMEVLSVYYPLVDENFVKKAKENGKEVHVWTVDDETEMRRLIKLGVTSILTNFPEKLIKVLAETK
ncbi:MAG: glycerophosphodiester phosphodiesterase family protein [Ignavibacteriaceae bacterium]|nr:glycerophosphodiester phosphodiesterase family protein [Ignavibacteriaceae bacterium]